MWKNMSSWLSCWLKRESQRPREVDFAFPLKTVIIHMLSILYQKYHQNHIHHIYQTNLTSLHTLAKAEQNQFAFRLV